MYISTGFNIYKNSCFCIVSTTMPATIKSIERYRLSWNIKRPISYIKILFMKNKYVTRVAIETNKIKKQNFKPFRIIFKSFLSKFFTINSKLVILVKIC